MAIEQIRTVLIIALCVVSFLLWDAWQRDYGPRVSQADEHRAAIRRCGAKCIGVAQRRCSAGTASGASRSGGIPNTGR